MRWVLTQVMLVEISKLMASGGGKELCPAVKMVLELQGMKKLGLPLGGGKEKAAEEVPGLDEVEMAKLLKAATEA